MTDKENQQQKREQAIVEEVCSDFKRRQEERRLLERGWQLNLNFLNGNQYCDVNTAGELENRQEGYFWQERRVFNRIAPIYDMRCARLGRIRPKLAVRAATEEEADRRAAKLASIILQACCEDCNLSGLLSSATVWSEACGTAFYKVIWDFNAGSEIGLTEKGESVKEGNVNILIVPPFEIYPDALTEENLQSQRSIIHARAVPVEDIYAAYGVKLAGRDITDSALPSALLGGGVKHGYETVIERYIRPNADYPEGRLTIVAGEKLLYDGALPYVNGENGARVYPFVKQASIPRAGGFFGTCVIDRMIPLQRAYNAVKNRKHEFLNRISMGTVAVEENSVDVDDLAENGLEPGRVITYRQGGSPPEILTLGSVPSEFSDEEQRLEEELAEVSGTSDITQKANAFTSVTSATGLQIIIEQEEARLNVCTDQIKSALKGIGKFILRLYRQFASAYRLIRFTGSGDSLSVKGFTGGDITGDDVIFEADSELNLSPARHRAAVLELVDRGLFNDESGVVSPALKHSLLENLGFTGALGERDLTELHAQRCAEENQKLKDGEAVDTHGYDDHAAHIKGHIACLLSEKLTAEQERRISAHINEHKQKLSEVQNEG